MSFVNFYTELIQTCILWYVLSLLAIAFSKKNSKLITDALFWRLTSCRVIIKIDCNKGSFSC